MSQVAPPSLREGLKTARILMVLSSISPLFILWAIRGNSLIPDKYFTGACAALVVLPNVFLWFRIWTAKKHNDKRELVVGQSDDHRDHILVYLFAMMLPFYSEDLDKWRQLWSTLTAVAFIVFLFWHLNLHYMNLLFAFRGYRVHTIYSPEDGNPLTGKMGLALITKRVHIPTGARIMAHRLSDTVYMESEG